MAAFHSLSFVVGTHAAFEPSLMSFITLLLIRSEMKI